MSSGVLPEEISTSRKIYPNRASLGDSIALATASQRVPLILAVAEVAEYSPAYMEFKDTNLDSGKVIKYTPSNSNVFEDFRYNTLGTRETRYASLRHFALKMPQ